jgi:hypothetical protein
MGNFILNIRQLSKEQKIAIGDAEDDPSLGLHIRSGQRIRIPRTRQQLDFGVKETIGSKHMYMPLSAAIIANKCI